MRDRFIYYMAALRRVVLNGNGFDVLRGNVAAVGAFAAAVVIVAVTTFRRRLD